jgi:hypothetical protein
MSPIEILAIVALVGYAIYKQTHVSEVNGKSRFKLAIIYGIVAASVGGFAVPHTPTALGLLLGSIALSVVLGTLRGRLTKVWMSADGRIYRQGTVLTVALFLGLIAAKFALGTFAYLEHTHDAETFGEIMLMIAIMVAVQAEIVWRRAKALTTSTANEVPVRT